MKRRYLWYQSANLQSADCIYKNGVIVEEDKTSVFNEIFTLADTVIKKEKPWVGRVGQYIFMKGLLNSTDELGRKMNFIYVTDYTERKVFKNNLLADFVVANIVMSNESDVCLADFVNYKEIKLTALAIGIGLVALLLKLLK